MKTIYLVRHASAVDKSEASTDFERSLTKNGMKDAENMAKKLKEKNITPDLLISSPAKRAFETALILAKELNYPVQNSILKNVIYESSSAESFLDLVHEAGDKYNSIMLVGHDPTMSQFAQFLIKDFQKNVPKAGVVAIELNKDSWKDIHQKDGELKFFEFPI